MSNNKNILILTYWNFNDALIQAYTLPYVRIMLNNLPKESKIYLVTLEKNQPSKEIIKIENRLLNVRMQYTPFGAKAAFSWLKNIFYLKKVIRKNSISTIHAWCTPAGMIGYILAKQTKRELIIDSYEPHAEAMVENGEWKKDSRAFKLLFRYEKKQTHKARYLIATTEGMRGYAKEKYQYEGNNFFVKPACVDLNQFSEKNLKNKKLIDQYELNNKIVAVYSGKFGGIYLDKEVFELFKCAFDYWGDKLRILILTSHSRAEIENWAKLAGLNPDIIINKFVPHNEVPDHVGLADFAITPVKPVPTKRFCTPIKDGEYWALGLPVIITKNISDDSQIIESTKTGAVLNNLDNDSYKKAILEIDAILKSGNRMEIYNSIRKIAEQYRNFSIAEKIYKTIYQ